jgi:hypothetical protein
MIQTKQIIVYGDRSEKNGKILVEVRQLEVTKEGIKFLVIDWDITNIPIDPNTPLSPIFSKEVFWTNQEINAMDAYLEQNNDFSALTKSEKEAKKMQLALYFTQCLIYCQAGKRFIDSPRTIGKSHRTNNGFYIIYCFFSLSRDSFPGGTFVDVFYQFI